MDLAILNFIRENLQSGVMDAVMRTVSFLGGAVIWLAVGGVLCFFKSYRVKGLALIICAVAAIVISEFAVKPFVMRERPFVTHGFELVVKEPRGSSFPSSHTAQSFAGATVLLSLRSRRLWGIFALLFAAAVGFSRMYLMVHYPGDVLAGAVLGVIIGAAAVFTCDRIVDKSP